MRHDLDERIVAYLEGAALAAAPMELRDCSTDRFRKPFRRIQLLP